MGYALNTHPLIMTLKELLELDEYANYSCAGCGKSIIVKEGVIEGTDNNHAYLVCEFCSQFINVDGSIDYISLQAALAEIVANAINPELSDEYSYPWA